LTLTWFQNLLSNSTCAATEWIAFLTLTYVALLEPVLVAFDTPLRLRGPPWDWSAVVDFVGGLTFLAAMGAHNRLHSCLYIWLTLIRGTINVVSTRWLYDM
jgi:hypothetical protein